MRDGRLDGGSLPAGVPVSSITDMYASGVNATILEVTDKQMEQINSQVDTWYRYTIKKEHILSKRRIFKQLHNLIF